VSFPRAFPELAREIFVHVPKCAGTDLTLNLRDRMLTLAVDTIAPAWIADDDFVARLAALARAAPEHDRLFVHGHFDLGPYLAGNGRRAGDRVFSIVREPVALMVSQANYKIGRLLQDPAGRDLDTAETLARLGMDRLPEPVIHTDLKDLAVRALLDPGIAQPNLACRHLGRGPESRFEDAILQIVANDVELTTTTHYDAWLHRRWAVPRSERHNRSVPWLTEYEAARLHGAHLDRATAEDRVLHDLVAWAIETTGGDCVTGRQLARLAAPRPLAGFARELSTARHEARRQLPRRPIVIEEPTFVALFLHRPSVPGAATVRTVLSAGFGTGGDGNAYLGCGWSAPEDGFVWSDGFAAELYLPACPGEGRLALRLVGSPFVADGAASRELVLSVNGWPVGESMLRDLSVVEFDVADDLAEGPLMLTIGVPGARMACETDGSDDKRRLGFCLRRVEAVRYAA
jgi:hypothetical protein